MVRYLGFTVLNAFDLSFDLFDFVGQEGLSELYSYEVTVASTDASIKFEDLIRQPGRLTWELDAVDANGRHRVRHVYGMVAAVQQGGVFTATDDAEANYYFYRLTLVPRVWALTLNHRSRVFKDTSVIDIITQVLEEAGFENRLDFKFEIPVGYGEYTDKDGKKQNYEIYPPREYTVQYQETDFDFISRLMEHEGLFYYFKMDIRGQNDVLVITDKNPDEDDTDIGAISMLQVAGTVVDPTIKRFVARQQVIPGRVRVWDHDYESFPNHCDEQDVMDPNDPGAPMKALQYCHSKATDTVSPPVSGVVEQMLDILKEQRDAIGQSADASSMVVDDKDPAEIEKEHLARVVQRRKEMIYANDHLVFRGKSDHVGFSGGWRFTLQDHFHTGLRGKCYRLLRVWHAGSMRGKTFGDRRAKAPGLPPYSKPFRSLWKRVHQAEQGGYTNRFTCIPEDVAYRPRQITAIPQVPGILTARIERYVGDNLLDEEGRYQVRLPFDENPDVDREPSRPVRMAQPYSGKDYGIHFPNHEGNEVVLAFIEGDIDRPIALGTVPNPYMHTPVPNTKRKLSSQNPYLGSSAAKGTYKETKNVIRTERGHQLVMDDDDGTANVGITLETGKSEPGGSLGRNVYWKSKLELGGYSVKSDLNRVFDIITEGGGWLMPILLRDWPQYTKLIPALLLTHMATGNYADEAFGSTKPVGAKLSTYQKAQVVGKNGVSISCPNILGFFEGPMVLPIEKDDPRLYMTTIINFVRNFLWRAVYRKESKELKRLGKDFLDKKKTNAEFGWELSGLYDLEKKRNFIRKHITNGLDLPGINIDSAGSIKLSSLQSITNAVGQGGYNIESFGDIKQTADLDASLEAKQKISIKTRGMPYKRGETLFWRDVVENWISKIPNPTLRTLVGLPSKLIYTICDLTQPVFRFLSDKKTLPIEITNENGDIFLKTEGKSAEKYEEERGNIELHADKGNILGFAPEGKVHVKSKTSDVLLREEGGLHLQSTEEIRLRCGKSSIRLNPDGRIFILGTEININGKKMIVKGSDELTLESAKTTVSAVAGAGFTPEEPVPPKDIVDKKPKPPEVITPPPSRAEDPKEIAFCAKANELAAKRYAEDLRKYTEWKVYEKQLELYYMQLEEAPSQPTASIELTAMPGDIAVDCTNYAAESKLRYDYKGLMVNGEAIGIHATRGALAKVN